MAEDQSIQRRIQPCPEGVQAHEDGAKVPAFLRAQVKELYREVVEGL